MKKITLFILFLLALSSCNTTRRAERRIYNITENHPELVKPDTVKIDTVLTVKPAADSVIFTLEDNAENEVDTILTNGGCFAISRLPSRQLKVVYLPDSFSLHYRENIVREKIHIEQPRELWRDILFYLILTFVFCLLVKTLIEKIFR